MTFEAPVPDHVRAIPPYRAGRVSSSVSREFNLDEAKIVKLASNENPLGMSPFARDALAAMRDDPSRYPDPDGFALRQALSERLGVPMDWITLGNGSTELLHLAARTFLAPGRVGIVSQYIFIACRGAIIAAGARAVVVPARNYGHDLEAMLRACTEEAYLVFVANPNNPTGTFIAADKIIDFVARVPEHVIILLDEAYLEYLEPGDRIDAMALVRHHPNLVIVRTFSKAYGLAGLRVGYCIAQPPVTEVLNRLRGPFNVNVYAQIAARASLDDLQFVEKSRLLNREGMARLTAALDGLGLAHIPSWGNFITVKVGDAAAINRQLLERGVIVRLIGDYGLPEWLRVTVGTQREIDVFLAALTAVLPLKI